MTYSRVALSLLLAVLGGAFLALESNDYHRRPTIGRASGTAPASQVVLPSDPCLAALESGGSFACDTPTEFSFESIGSPDLADNDTAATSLASYEFADEHASQLSHAEAFYGQQGYHFIAPESVVGFQPDFSGLMRDAFGGYCAGVVPPYDASRVFALNIANSETIENKSPESATTEEYGYLERHHGEPGEISARFQEDEPLCYVRIDPSDYERFDYYSPEARRAIQRASGTLDSSDGYGGPLSVVSSEVRRYGELLIITAAKLWKQAYENPELGGEQSSLQGGINASSSDEGNRKTTLRNALTPSFK